MIKIEVRKMNKLLLILAFIYTKIYAITNQYCELTNENSGSLLCSMFTDFSQLNLTGFKDSNITFTSLEFIPQTPLFFDNSLSLDGLTVDETYVVRLQNVNKFDILSNPFAILDYKKRVSLFFINSVFDYLF